MRSRETVQLFVARLLMSSIFIISGVAKIFDLQGTADYMASKGMVAIPLLLALAILVEVGGGLALLFNYRTQLATLALIAMLIPTTLIFHDFWAVAPDQRPIQLVHFLKNLAILGGLVYVNGVRKERAALAHPEGIIQEIPERLRA